MGQGPLVSLQRHPGVMAERHDAAMLRMDLRTDGRDPRKSRAVRRLTVLCESCCKLHSTPRQEHKRMLAWIPLFSGMTEVGGARATHKGCHPGRVMPEACLQHGAARSGATLIRDPAKNASQTP
jgi:hypothetical protein